MKKENNKQIIKYLIWTFGLAYIIQFIAGYVYNNINITIGQLIVALMMFVPTIGVLLSGYKLKNIGWKPNIKKNIKYILIAWLSPIILTALGACIYFLLFPSHFDLSGSYLISVIGEEAFSQLGEAGISYTTYIIISIVQVLTYAPLINMFLGLGEEIGWRGFLYPSLKTKLGKKIGLLIGGLIWSSWHWPLIWLIGYEYGGAAGNSVGYFGFPFVGMLLFTIFATSLGIIEDRLYEKTNDIWLPSLLHGCINAAVTIPLTMCIINTGSIRLLGPQPMGVLAGLPLTIFATILFFKKEK